MPSTSQKNTTAAELGRVLKLTHTRLMGITPIPPEDADKVAEVAAEVERYCEEHPRSPTALRRPRVMIRGRSCVALLGSTLEEGIAGIGSTVASALRAFDVQYANSLKPPRG